MMGCVASLRNDLTACRDRVMVNHNDQAANRDDRNRQPSTVVGQADRAQTDGGVENRIYHDIDESADSISEQSGSYQSLTLGDRSNYTMPGSGVDNGPHAMVTRTVSYQRPSEVRPDVTTGRTRASLAISLSDFTVSSPSTEMFNRRFLECPICLDQYKNPKILPCYHSFCQQCLTKVASAGKITCPVCQQCHDLPAEGAEVLPNCTILNDLLEFTDSTKEVEENNTMIHICGSCKRNQAGNFCVDCGILMCDPCCESHRNIPVTKKHTLMTLEEYREEVLVKSRVYRPVVCPLHEGNQITYYCATCEVPICGECAEKGHPKSGHQLETPSEAKEKRKDKLRKMLKVAKDKLASAEEVKAKMGAAGPEFEDRMGREKRQLETGLEEMGKKLELLMDYFTTNRESMTSDFQSKMNKTEELIKLQKETNSKVSELSRSIDDTEGLLEKSNDIGFLYVVNHSMKRLQTVVTASAPVDSASDVTEFEFSADTKLQELNATLVDILLNNTSD